MSEPKEGMNSGNIETMEIRLLEAVDHGIVATDTRGRITYWNRFAEHLTGFPGTVPRKHPDCEHKEDRDQR